MSAHAFVAHFLKENGYLNTLAAFESEHGNVISTDLPYEETLEDILSDRLRYLKIDEKHEAYLEEFLDADLKEIKQTQIRQWLAPYPRNASELGAVGELIVDSAFLHLNGVSYCLLATSSKSLVVVDLSTKNRILTISNVVGNVVVRRIVLAPNIPNQPNQNLVILCGMNGQVSVGKLSLDLQSFEVFSQTQLHPRLITDIRVVEWHQKLILVSMGWDFYVKVHEIDENNQYVLKCLGTSFKLQNQGSCLDAVVFQNKVYVVVCKQEITLMDVLCLENELNDLHLECRVALNDAEFSASGFTPMSVKIHYNDGQGVPLVAVGTSHEPEMRVILVLLNGVGQKTGANGEELKIWRNQILCNYNTSSPQDKYSEGKIEWRHDGSGIWVIGDDGVIRGLDLTDGSIVVKLEAHEGRIKSACFDENIVVSCGTDRRVFKWEKSRTS